MPRLSGLRARLVVGFFLVAALSATFTGALTFREARTGVLQQSQDAVIELLRTQADRLAPELGYPPHEAGWRRFAAEVARADPAGTWRVMATFGSVSATSVPGDPFPELTPAVRDAVGRSLATVFQRVGSGDHTSLVVGMSVTFAAADGDSPRPSGVHLFLTVPQTAERATVDALVTAIERAAVPALTLAVLLALLAARGVLRPVRALRGATRSIAEGRLDTRLAVHGSDELAELSRTFNDTAAALEKSVAELRDMEARARRFAADVSHELRTPLAAMSVVTDVLHEDAARLDADTATAVRLIGEETVKLARLVDDLMEISRFDAGAARLHLDEIDLAESLRHTLAARAWTDAVDCDLPPPGALRGRVDPRRLDVVVANLVGNALRHGAPPVRLRLREEAGSGGERQAVIEVLDSGPGIAAEVLPHVFERFYKSDAARTRTEGSGLGLAITAENVRVHGGTVRAGNQPEGGTVFTVRLPLPEGDSPPDPPAEGDPSRHGPSGQDRSSGEDRPSGRDRASQEGRSPGEGSSSQEGRAPRKGGLSQEGRSSGEDRSW